jgi:negative regulator of sigma E activity
MNEERPPNEPGAQQGERDSQLSAMFDGELSAAECELLARRLSRDEALRGQWSRYALIGAAVRAERGVKLDDRVAHRVQVQIAQEATYGDSADNTGTVMRPAVAAQSSSSARVNAYERWLRFARPVAGAGIAAGVAAMSILWLQAQDADPEMMAATPAAESIVLQPEASSPAMLTASAQPPSENQVRTVSNGEPERYSTPAPTIQTSIAPPAHFANYVVAHSEVSGPLARRLALLGIVGTEAAEMPEPTENKPPQLNNDNRGVVDAP